MKRFLILVPLWLFLVAASPAGEAGQLLKAGKDKEAFELISKTAASNDAEALDFLAWFYEEGRHVAQDVAKAATLYRRAAEAGNPHAQWRLGVMLDLSEGVKSNPDEAVVWIRKAANQAYPSAIASLAAMYANGRGVPVDYAESRRLYMQAGKAGESHGFFGIAALYMNGQGVVRDPLESLAWMLVAATLGDKQAEEKVPSYGLNTADTQAAAGRANQIFRELGLKNVEVRFRDVDAETAQPEK